MKLKYQLNAAFTTLLLVIMAVTGFVIYSLILDMLVEDEQRQLKQKGEILVNILNQQYDRQNVQAFSDFLETQDLQLFLYDREYNRVLYTSLPRQAAQGFVKSNDIADAKETLWTYNNNKYVTSRILFYPRESGMELIMLTPMTDLQAVQQSFVQRLLIVFLVGGVLAIVLSYYLTNKLVTPLTQLRMELKKIEKRQFDAIQPIQATGEIKDLEKSVHDMADALHKYMTSQQAFFQNASHELKTPLMSIQGYAEGIRDHIFDEAETEKGLDVMVTEVKRLKKIINEMILLAKLDSEPSFYEPTRVDVKQLLEQAIDRTKPIAHEKGIELHLNADTDINIYVDEEKFLRALLNLMTNCIRHGAGHVHMTVKKALDHTEIVIEDDGDGIPENIVHQIFQRFVKGKSGETGLGLSIARAIIEQSGGRITAGQSEFGGAKFTVLISLRTEKQEKKHR
ncbi:sensor histidine kinase [Lentibacillus saliphilus]|uniref:sensor histidine kinase n=1 Tax=Lentibacillus saliphilus TaxID=2737028 RepID=UPI001C2F7186|nr:HAMP domain-containing sensor histidine kinase [Lentibacillus saliphilus]